MHGSQMIYATLLMILAALPAWKGTAAAAEYTCDPRVTALFPPPRPLLGRYEVCTTPASVEALVEATPAPSRAARRYGAIEALEALDAFGAAGTYKRAALS